MLIEGHYFGIEKMRSEKHGIGILQADIVLLKFKRALISGSTPLLAGKNMAVRR